MAVSPLNQNQSQNDISMDTKEPDENTLRYVHHYFFMIEEFLQSVHNSTYYIIPKPIRNLCILYMYRGISDSLRWFAPGSSLLFINKHILKFNNHSWNFNNNLVSNYRINANKRNHNLLLPKPEQICFPKYISNIPIPTLPFDRFLLKIRLPIKYSKLRRYTSSKIIPQSTKATDLIKYLVINKLDDPYNNDSEINNFVLKVIGKESYIYGNQLIINFKAVRKLLWEDDCVHIILFYIKENVFKKRIESEKEQQIAYKKHFKTIYNVCDIVKNTKKSISLYDCEWTYRLKIVGLTNVKYLPRINLAAIKSIYILCELWIGNIMIRGGTIKTKQCLLINNNIRFGQWLYSDRKNLAIAQLPKETTICFMVMAVYDNNDKKENPKKSGKSFLFKNHKNDQKSNKEIEDCLAWCRVPLIDNLNKFRSGKYGLNLWEIPIFKRERHGASSDPSINKSFRYCGTTRDRYIKQNDVNTSTQCKLFIEFDTFVFDVVAPDDIPNKYDIDDIINVSTTDIDIDDNKTNVIDDILHKTHLELSSLTPNKKRLIWNSRQLLSKKENTLYPFLYSVDWTNLNQIKEVHKYLDLWKPPTNPQFVVECLSYKFMDTKLREKAVSWLENLNDDDLYNILLILVQCIKYELYHTSSLSVFLMRRALQSPNVIGHFFFWYLYYEFKDNNNFEYIERYALLIEEYLFHSAQHSKQLFIQIIILNKLKLISDRIDILRKPSVDKIKDIKNTKVIFRGIITLFNRNLSNNNLTFQLPINPEWHFKQLQIQKCRYMSSKRTQLQLVFQNVDNIAHDTHILFKIDNNIFPYMFIAQIINIINDIWLQNKLYFCLQKHLVLSITNNIGIIHMQKDSMTLNQVDIEFGGPWNPKTIDAYLKKYNKNDTVLKNARMKFTRSCSGYCIITWILGISDRHTDHIIIEPSGKMFHIDFRHFCGNYKTKFGFKRERSLFHFTPNMKYAIDQHKSKSDDYQEFLDYSANGFMKLREKSTLIESLFICMMVSNIPELSNENGIFIKYFHNQLKLQLKTKEKCAKYVHKAIKCAFKDRLRMIDTIIHIRRHS